jgi:hypothetical protein
MLQLQVMLAQQQELGVPVHPHMYAQSGRHVNFVQLENSSGAERTTQ